jgi:hypothetical protein
MLEGLAIWQLVVKPLQLQGLKGLDGIAQLVKGHNAE